MANQTYRVLELIRRFNNNEKVCISQLQNGTYLKAEHFKAKKYLPSQSITEEKENGSLIVSFTVTQEREVEELVKRWLPYMKVISPDSLKERIDRDLVKYLESGK